MFKEFVLEAANDNNLKPRFDYSGRCMFGKTCFGLVGSIGSIAGFLIDLTERCTAEDDRNDDFGYAKQLERFRNMSMDSMGLDSIMYFPEVHIEADVEIDEYPEDDVPPGAPDQRI